MPDKYSSIRKLKENEVRDQDYKIILEDRQSPILIAAPHGGRIEPYTSELAKLVAGSHFSLYLFEGLKADGHKGTNRDLHVTSHNFFEETLDKALESTDTVITFHGVKDFEEELIIIGGLDRELGGEIKCALKNEGFIVKDNIAKYAGKEPRNICNRGRTKKGVQLEIIRTLRRRMAEDEALRSRFVSAIQSVLKVRKIS